MKLLTSLIFTTIFALFIAGASEANPLAVVGISLVASSLVIIPSGVLAAKIGSMAGAATTTLQIQYVPEFITFVSVLPPTSLKVEVLGDGTIMNLDVVGVDVMNNIGNLGTQANRYMFQIANGLITGKTVEITMANANAGAVDVYGLSPDGEGNAYAVYQKNTILANSGKDLTNFAAIGIAAPTANDIFIIEYEDGTQDKLSIEEIDAYQTLQQNFDPSAAGLLINNTEQQYSKVNITPDTNRGVYLLDFQAAGQVDNEIE